MRENTDLIRTHRGIPIHSPCPKSNIFFVTWGGLGHYKNSIKNPAAEAHHLHLPSCAPDDILDGND